MTMMRINNKTCSLITGPILSRVGFAQLCIVGLVSVVTLNIAQGQAPPPPGYANLNTFPSSQPTATLQSQRPNNFEQQPAARIASASSPPIVAPTANTTPPNSFDSNLINDERESIPMTNLLSVIQRGGVLMIPIIGCSMIMLVFVMERLLYLRRSRIIPRSFVRGVIEQLEQQQLTKEEAIALCDDNGSPMAQLFAAALKKYGRPAVEVEQAVLDSGERVTNQLRKYLRLFNAISNLTPLLGLLGTVLGMIDAFNTIARADAMGRPEMLAGGIGTALITTAAGLLVAIPAYAAYVFFLGRTDKLILELDAYAQNVVELICAEGLQETSRSRRTRKAA